VCVCVCVCVFYMVLMTSLPPEINRSYQMSSFVETKALEQLTKCPVEFVEYPVILKYILIHTRLNTRTASTLFSYGK